MGPSKNKCITTRKAAPSTYSTHSEGERECVSVCVSKSSICTMEIQAFAKVDREMCASPGHQSHANPRGDAHQSWVHSSGNRKPTSRHFLLEAIAVPEGTAQRKFHRLLQGHLHRQANFLLPVEEHHKFSALGGPPPHRWRRANGIFRFLPPQQEGWGERPLNSDSLASFRTWRLTFLATFLTIRRPTSVFMGSRLFSSFSRHACALCTAIPTTHKTPPSNRNTSFKAVITTHPPPFLSQTTSNSSTKQQETTTTTSSKSNHSHRKKTPSHHPTLPPRTTGAPGRRDTFSWLIFSAFSLFSWPTRAYSCSVSNRRRSSRALVSSMSSSSHAYRASPAALSTVRGGWGPHTFVYIPISLVVSVLVCCYHS